RCGAGQVRRGAPQQAAPGHARAVGRSLRGRRSRAAGRDVMTALLPTSSAGSLRNPSWLAQTENVRSPRKLDDGELAEGKRDAVRLALAEQQAAGIDIVSDGEQTRQHFVPTFIENLGGVDFENRRVMPIRDRYEAAVPVVVEA